MAFSETSADASPLSDDTKEKHWAKEKNTKTRTEERAANARDAVKAVATCLGTDVIDPYFGKKVQEWLAKKYNLKEHGGTGEVWGGEIVGDVFSGVALFAAREFCPKTMKYLSKAISIPLEGVYNKLAPKFIEPTDDPVERNRRIEEWKQYQRENIANGALFSVAGTATNVAAQKFAFKNPSPTWHILTGKVCGAATTMAVLAGSHAVFPQLMGGLDKVLSEHAFEPIVDFVQRQFGFDEKAVGNHTAKLADDRNTATLAR